MKAYRRMGIKIYTNELGHMTKMAVMLIYMAETFKNLLFQNLLTDGLETLSM